VGAFNALIGTIMAIQIPPTRVGFFPYVILLCGLVLMFSGYYTGKRRDGS
jgi:VIT1/CCC1 family predicted Fe2+/Mn2+ transporter